MSSPTTPTTSQRPTANTGRKRTGPVLLRDTWSPSHHDSMSAIFQAADTALRASPTPKLSSTHARRVPMSLSAPPRRKHNMLHSSDVQDSRSMEGSPQLSSKPYRLEHCLGHPTDLPRTDSILAEREDRSQQSTSFGQSKSTSGTAIAQQNERKTIDTGITPTPAGVSPVKAQWSPDKVVYPDLSKSTFESARSSRTGVENWLHDVPESTASVPINKFDSPSTPVMMRKSPSKIPLASRSNGLSTPKLPVSEKSPSIIASASRGPPVAGSLTDPPLRRKARASPSKPHVRSDLDKKSTTHKSIPAEEIVALSPRVQQFRRGCGPNKERCMSYWDKDIFPELAPEPEDKMNETGGRQVHRKK
ncbi:MAG: hypothetical protein Q9220_005163 [cf. Caloplaca sp. 1 TL-2023]